MCDVYVSVWIKAFIRMCTGCSISGGSMSACASSNGSTNTTKPVVLNWDVTLETARGAMWLGAAGRFTRLPLGSLGSYALRCK